MMSDRVSKVLRIDWSSLPHALEKRRILKLRPNEGKFTCLIENCLHDDFASSRGLRKHIESRHPWYFYFDNEPSIKDKILEARSKKMHVEQIVPHIETHSALTKESVSAFLIGSLPNAEEGVLLTMLNSRVEGL